MAGFDHPDVPGRHAMAVAGGGDAGQPGRLQFERVEIMPLRGRSERSGALAGGKADHPAFRHRAQMAAEHDVGMSGGHGRIEDRAQEGTSVGHRFTEAAEGNLGCRLSIQSLQKKTPAGRPRGRLGPQMGRSEFAMAGKRLRASRGAGSLEENASGASRRRHRREFRRSVPTSRP